MEYFPKDDCDYADAHKYQYTVYGLIGNDIEDVPEMYRIMSEVWRKLYEDGKGLWVRRLPTIEPEGLHDEDNPRYKLVFRVSPKKPVSWETTSFVAPFVKKEGEGLLSLEQYVAMTSASDDAVGNIAYLPPSVSLAPPKDEPKDEYDFGDNIMSEQKKAHLKGLMGQAAFDQMFKRKPQ